MQIQLLEQLNFINKGKPPNSKAHKQQPYLQLLSIDHEARTTYPLLILNFKNMRWQFPILLSDNIVKYYQDIKIKLYEIIETQIEIKKKKKTLRNIRKRIINELRYVD